MSGAEDIVVADDANYYDAVEQKRTCTMKKQVGFFFIQYKPSSCFLSFKTPSTKKVSETFPYKEVAADAIQG